MYREVDLHFIITKYIKTVYTIQYIGGKQWQTSPRTCPGCSVPEPYRSHDWALVPAKPGLQG